MIACMYVSMYICMYVHRTLYVYIVYCITKEGESSFQRSRARSMSTVSMRHVGRIRPKPIAQKAIPIWFGTHGLGRVHEED